jgi:membrane-associated phospholipid phosphatase
MTQQNDLTAEALRRGAVPGRGYALARMLSQVLHPVILGVISIFIVGLLGVESTRAGIVWALACTFLQVVPPTIYFTIRLRQGAYSDDDVSVRSQRNELYLFGMLNLLVGMLLLGLFGVPRPLMAMLVSALLVNVLAWAVNLTWKISVHSAGIGSTAALASIYSQPLGLAFWLCAAALGWARVRTRNHTPMQVAAGLALAAACVLGTYWAFGLL